MVSFGILDSTIRNRYFFLKEVVDGKSPLEASESSLLVLRNSMA
jgi:hypothetical protein